MNTFEMVIGEWEQRNDADHKRWYEWETDDEWHTEDRTIFYDPEKHEMIDIIDTDKFHNPLRATFKMR